MKQRRLVVLLLSCLALQSCGRDRQAVPMFRLLPPSETGVTFTNTVTTTDSVNVQTDALIYNGGGVAIGDFDNDGLADIFLTGNMVSSRLYLNKGDMRFEDITESAGLATDRWASGASVVDINSDGYLDIYISVSGPEWSTPAERANLLFLNNGDLTFREAAAEYRIDDTGFTTHAVFFDSDRDGYLDLYLLGNNPGEFARGEAERHPAGVASKSTASHDRLYRNNGNGTFTDVSREAGILAEVGFGLGVVVTDLNADGWPDLYISNDDTPSDVLYVNNGDGTFTDKAGVWLLHTSFAGMGIDIADFNNDGWPDIFQTDMAPEDLAARKRMAGATTYRGFMELRRRGFRHDYNVNTLQLSNGLMQDGSISFSEISRLAGVAYTHWSWSVLFGDYDNDGFKDILVTNGYPKAVIDFDYQIEMYSARQNDDRERGLKILEELDTYEATNYAFRNRGDLTFSDETVTWGMNHSGFSYGAAHADLNNDGRLDVVINNIDAPAFIYQNVQPIADAGHYLQVALEGEPPNNHGVGSSVMLVARGQRQYVYHTPYRGYISSMDDKVHFGLGPADRVDSLEVIWPDGRHQLLRDLAVDQVVIVRQADATTNAKRSHFAAPLSNHVFEPLNPGSGLGYEHRESSFVDYTVQPLLPYMISKQGPPIAVGDVTGDGLDDVFIGAGGGAAGALFLQTQDGRFIESQNAQPWVWDEQQEDWGAIFFDANGDGRLDLYVASGGYRSSRAELLQDRLYINRGGGRFERDAEAFPPMPTSTAAVTAGDFTGDGKPDLFVGGRLVPRSYPHPARSYLLRNDGGTFTDVTSSVAPELHASGGMITSAVWVDFTGDGRLDLVTAGEWMPLQFFQNDGTQFRNVTDSMDLPPMRGWWYSLATGDFNNDGHPDIVAGNLGLNYSFKTSEESQFGLYAGDFTGNATTDLVFTQEIDATEYPYFGLAKLGQEIYTVGVRFKSYGSFANASVRDVFSPSQLDQALHYQADTFASVYLQNDGDGTFSAMPLPNLAQVSPIRGIIATDVDGDGHLDLVVAGNLYHAEPNTPRADAGKGLWLKNDGRGHFTAVPPFESGLLAPHDVVGLASVNTPKGKVLLVANHGDSLQAFVIKPQ